MTIFKELLEQVRKRAEGGGVDHEEKENDTNGCCG